MQKRFHIIHRTELLPLFKKENKPQECGILLATVNEVKGGRWEGMAKAKEETGQLGEQLLGCCYPSSPACGPRR